MLSTHSGSATRTAPRFARCPKCQELIDAASESCRFCGAHFTPGELDQSAALQEKLTQAKARANNRSAMISAILGLFGAILLYGFWFLVRFMTR
jgi:hypothetical protein